MLSKLAISNVKKSFKDYFIYFITLTFAVCIFYSFNSIDAQNSMIELGESTESYILTLNKLISVVSVFVAIVLGCLIAYANNFLIRRRKKEFAIYMSLGMPKTKISKILVIEMLMIGLISLVIGITLGIFVSQGLSIITARLLVLNVTKYTFTLSVNAIIKTFVNFGVIYLLVMLINQRTIAKYQLIDLLTAAKQNEKVKLTNPISSVFIFILSIIIIVFAYYFALKVGVAPENPLFAVAIILGIVGTLLCFFSLSNFIVVATQKRKKIYFKDLNIFILRQLNNKINTNFLSMTVICLMIFLTITLLFTMLSFKGSYDKLVKGNNSFDGSIQLFINEEDQPITQVKDYLQLLNYDYEQLNHSFFNEYKLSLTVDELLNDFLTEKEKQDLAENYLDGPISMIMNSEYNSINEILGRSPIQLDHDEVLLVSNYQQMNPALDRFMKNENMITIDNRIYTIKNDEPITENVVTTAMYLDFFYLIVPDDFLGEFTLHSSGFNVMFENDQQDEANFTTLINNDLDSSLINGTYIPVFGHTIESVNIRIHGSTTMVVFLGVYLGLVFLVSSAAVLALQQLSDMSDSLERYSSLKKIGVTEKFINKAILIQILIYFMIPIILAIIHSVIGMIAINRIFSAYSGSIIGSSSIMIAIALVIIYGGYFYATYIGSKNIVRNYK